MGDGAPAPPMTNGVFAAAAKMGGASPVCPMSMAPALSASVSAGPLSNSDQLTPGASLRALSRLKPPKRC